MPRIKPIFVLCLALLDLTYAIDHQSVNFTKKWSIEFYHDTEDHVVKANDSIILVGTYDNSINMTTLDGVQINICEYSPSFNHTYRHAKQAVALGNGKILVHNFIDNENEDMIQNLILILDPRNCSSTKTLDLRLDNQTFSGLPFIVPYHDSFDLFFWNKTIGRFNDLAEPIIATNLTYDLDILGLESQDEYLQTVKPYDASKGYIFRQNLFDNITLLKRLDSKLQPVEETSFEPDMRVISTTHNRISTCYQDYDERMFHWYSICYFFDLKDLSRQASVQMYRSTSDFQVSHAEVANLPDGSSIVALSFELADYYMDKDKVPKHAIEYYLQRVNADGSTEKPVFVDTYYNVLQGSTMSIALLDGGEVCLIVKNYWFEGALFKHRFNTKCLLLD